MEMSIEEAINHLGNYSSTNGSGLTTDKQHNEAKRVAIDIMRKYQKMQGGLDKIRAEILEDCGYSKDYVGAFTYSTIKVATVLQILDKYKAETEAEDGNV